MTVDGSESDGALKITGNNKANYLFGGDHGTTLNGGLGDDKIFGGAGNDS